MQLDSKVLKLKNDVVYHRRYLHSIPEIAFHEFKTQEYILDVLRDFKPDRIETIAGTGVKAVFLSPNENARTIAFRADIDALALTEQTGAEYASCHEGFMHACGHDAHAAVLLGFSQLVSQNIDKLGCNIVVLFQPAEESVGGAKRMIDEGALKNPDVDEIYGLHVWPDVPLGSIGYREGPMMAQTFEFDIEVFGKSAHGASPHKGIDAIVAAAELIDSMQTIVTRTVDPFEKKLITIGRICGGQTRNVIADYVQMNGTIRTFSNEVLEMMLTRMHQLLKGLEISNGVTTKLKEIMRYPVVSNPPKQCEFLAKVMGYKDIVIVDEVMAAEDFSFYQQQVPGVFFRIGIGKPGQYPLHSVKFDLDEQALLNGVEVFARLAGIIDCE